TPCAATPFLPAELARSMHYHPPPRSRTQKRWSGAPERGELFPPTVRAESPVRGFAPGTVAGGPPVLQTQGRSLTEGHPTTLLPPTSLPRRKSAEPPAAWFPRQAASFFLPQGNDPRWPEGAWRCTLVPVCPSPKRERGILRPSLTLQAPPALGRREEHP